MDDRYPHLYVGARVCLDGSQPDFPGTVIRYGYGDGAPWIVKWDRVSTFDGGLTYTDCYPHLGGELKQWRPHS